MIKFNPWLHDIVLKSTHQFIRDSESHIQYFFDLGSKMPSEYRWRTTSVEVFTKQVNHIIKNKGSADDLNSLYWYDMACDIEAYGVMVFWRAIELLKTALTSLNSEEILPPSILSRSMLELAASYLVNSKRIIQTVENVVKNSQNEMNTLICCKDLEEIIVKMIHGTRIGKPSKELRQTNAQTYLEKLAAKFPQLSEILTTYEFLCDISHPNVIGNARYWASVESESDEESKILRMERHAESATTLHIIENTLFALAWSAVSIRNSFELGQSSVVIILDRWPRKKIYH